MKKNIDVLSVDPLKNSLLKKNSIDRFGIDHILKKELHIKIEKYNSYLI